MLTIAQKTACAGRFWSKTAIHLPVFLDLDRIWLIVNRVVVLIDVIFEIICRDRLVYWHAINILIQCTTQIRWGDHFLRILTCCFDLILLV